MKNWLLAVPVVAVLAACSTVLPTAPEVTVPTAPEAETQAMCNTIAANEAAIRSWLKWPDAFGFDATARVEAYIAENDQLKAALEARDKICVVE